MTAPFVPTYPPWGAKCQHCRSWKCYNLAFGACWSPAFAEDKGEQLPITTPHNYVCDFYQDKLANRASHEAGKGQH